MMRYIYINTTYIQSFETLSFHDKISQQSMITTCTCLCSEGYTRMHAFSSLHCISFSVFFSLLKLSEMSAPPLVATRLRWFAMNDLGGRLL